MVKTNILLESGTNELEIVEFYMNEADRIDADGVVRGYYAINVAKVLEIIREPELTDLPEISHAAVLGAFDLRNRIVPLVDLGQWLRKKVMDIEPPKVIVTEFNRVTTGFLVSGVTRIHRISWEQVEAPNPYVSSLASNSITGVVKLEGRIIYLLDMERIVSDLNPEIIDAGIAEDDVTEEIRRRRLRVLVADDSSTARGFFRELLEKAGFKIVLVNNGREAWDMLQTFKRRARDEARPLGSYVNAVVTDVEMPVMDGHNLTVRIRNDVVLRDLPVVLCSSIITDTLLHKGEAVGADAQISKAEMKDLPQRILRLIVG